jgi:hypothetical protein
MSLAYTPSNSEKKSSSSRCTTIRPRREGVLAQDVLFQPSRLMQGRGDEPVADIGFTQTLLVHRWPKT